MFHPSGLLTLIVSLFLNLKLIRKLRFQSKIIVVLKVETFFLLSQEIGVSRNVYSKSSYRRYCYYYWSYKIRRRYTICNRYVSLYMYKVKIISVIETFCIYIYTYVYTFNTYILEGKCLLLWLRIVPIQWSGYNISIIHQLNNERFGY